MTTELLERSATEDRQTRASDYPKKSRVQLELKAVTEDGTFEGYANVFDVVDLGGDMIHHGAFAKNLQEQGNKRKLLWQHNHAAPIGSVTLAEDLIGLKVELGRFMKGVQIADDALQTARFWKAEGLTVEMSIGWRPVPGKTEFDKQGVFHIFEAKVHEVSIVTMAMNPDSTVTALKTVQGYAGLAVGERNRGYWAPGAELKAIEKSISDGHTDASALSQAYLVVKGDAPGAADLPFLMARMGAEGRLEVDPTACTEIAGELYSGASGGLSGDELAAAQKHLGRYLRIIGVEPPWEKQSSLEAMARSLALTAGERLSSEAKQELLILSGADAKSLQTGPAASPQEEPVTDHSNLSGLLAQLSATAKGL